MKLFFFLVGGARLIFFLQFPFPSPLNLFGSIFLSIFSPIRFPSSSSAPPPPPRPAFSLFLFSFYRGGGARAPASPGSWIPQWHYSIRYIDLYTWTLYCAAWVCSCHPRPTPFIHVRNSISDWLKTSNVTK